jgi:methionine--tRNA ligase beta chain
MKFALAYLSSFRSSRRIISNSNFFNSFNKICNMSATVTSKSIQIVDEIIGHVKNAAVAKQSNINASSPLTSNNSAIPIATTDVAWFPIVPPGHTVYTWYGASDGSASNNNSNNTAATNERKQPTAQAAEKQQNNENAQQNNTQQQAERKPKQQQPQGEKKPSNKPAKAEEAKFNPDAPSISRLDIRVGKILTAGKHPDADSLYVEEIDLGEEKPRVVVSGLVKYISLEDFIGSYVLVITNLKPSPLRGVKSYGMVLAASNGEHTVVELVRPPTGAKIGERINVEGLDISQFNPEASVDPKKANNAWELTKPKLRVDKEGFASFDGKKITTSAGFCRPKQLTDVQIS